MCAPPFLQSGLIPTPFILGLRKFFASSCLRCISHITCDDTCWRIPSTSFLHSTKTQVSSGVGSLSSPFCQFFTPQWKLAASCVAAWKTSLFVAPILVRFSLPSVAKTFQELLFFLLLSMRFCVLRATFLLVCGIYFQMAISRSSTFVLCQYNSFLFSNIKKLEVSRVRNRGSPIRLSLKP